MPFSKKQSDSTLENKAQNIVLLYLREVDNALNLTQFRKNWVGGEKKRKEIEKQCAAPNW